MRAAVIERFGGPDVIEIRDVPEPVIGPGDVLVEVDACGVNPHDAWVRAGKRAGVAFPRVLGIEPAGVVAAVGADVRGVAVGDRVVVHPHVPCDRCRTCAAGARTACRDAVLFGQQVDGGYAERVAVPARAVLATPPSLDRVAAAAVAVTFVTAWHALVTRGRLRAGETVVVSGATGGLGLAAVQVAKLAGARVVATTSRPAAHRRLEELGAHLVLDRGDDLTARVLSETGGLGADAWLDHAGGAGFGAAVEALAPRGRLISCGAGAGDAVSMNVRELYPSEREVVGAIAGDVGEQSTVLGLLGTGDLVPVISDVLPLRDAAAAHELLATGGHFGKIVLDVHA